MTFLFPVDMWITIFDKFFIKNYIKHRRTSFKEELRGVFLTTANIMQYLGVNNLMVLNLKNRGYLWFLDFNKYFSSCHFLKRQFLF